MSGTTDNLAIVEVATNQTDKELIISTALNDFDDATQRDYALTFVSNLLTLTGTVFNRNFCFIGGDVGGNLTATGTLTVPDNSRAFAVRNDGSVQSIVVTTGAGGGALNATIAAGEMNNIYSDGTNVTPNTIFVSTDIVIASNPFINAGTVASGGTITPATLTAQSLIGSHGTVATDLSIGTQFTITSGNTFGFNSALVDLSGVTEVKVPTPVNPADAVTKAYADAAIQGLSIKPTAVVATTTTLPAYTYANGTAGVGATLTGTATGTLTIDGHLTALGDVILVKNETSTNQPNNGLYTVTTAGASGVAYVLTRSIDMDSSLKFTGALIAVGEVSVTYPGTLWLCNQTAPTVGTTNVGFTEVSAVAASQWSAGTVSAISPNFTIISNTMSLAPTLDLTALTEVKVPVGANATDATQKTYVDNATGLGLVMQGYKSGGTIAWTSTTSFTVATAQVMSDDATTMMTLGSALTKTTSSWVAGSAAGGLDTGTISASAWYHVFVIYNPSTKVTDVLFSLSPTSPTLPSGYTKQRRIGSQVTSSSNFVKIFQNGGRFDWGSPTNSANAVVPGVTTATSVTLAVPSGVVVEAILDIITTDSSATSTGFYISSLATTDVAVSGTTGETSITPGAAGTFASTPGVRVETNATQQVRVRTNSTTLAYYINVIGWIDNAGAASSGSGSVWNGGVVNAIGANLAINSGTLAVTASPTFTNLTLGGTLSGVSNFAMTGTLSGLPVTGNSIALNGGSIQVGGSVTLAATASATLTLSPTLGIKDVIVNMPSAGGAVTFDLASTVANQEWKLHIKQGATASTLTLTNKFIYAPTGGPTSFTVTGTAATRDILWMENLDGTHAVIGAVLQGVTI